MRDIGDLKGEMSKGTIKFCKPCSISIYACRVSDAFIQGLASATGCKVTASGGACQKNPNGGGWVTNPDNPGDSNQFRESDGGPPVDVGHTFQPPLFP